MRSHRTIKTVWLTLVVVAVVSAQPHDARADGWSVDEGVDEFTDLPVVTASVESDGGDQLVIRCTEEKVLYSIYEPQQALLSQELSVRYRIDKLDVVDSTLSWENRNGRALTALTTRKSLFKNELSESERSELFSLLEGLMNGTRFVIEADGERASFSLSGSGKAVGDALSACDVLFE